MKKKLVHSFTTTWDNSASAINWLMEQGICDSIDSNSAYQVKAGFIKMMIISIASVIEGSLRTVLLYTWRDLQNEKLKLEEKANTQKSFSLALTKERMILSQKVRKLRKIGIAKDKVTWSKLSSQFGKIRNSTMKKEMDKISPNLYFDLEMLFKFRNFLVHSNHIVNLMSPSSDDFIHKFDREAVRLYEYIQNNHLYDELNESDYITEKLLTSELLAKFHGVMNDFFKLDNFKENHLRNTMNLIYKI